MLQTTTEITATKDMKPTSATVIANLSTGNPNASTENQNSTQKTTPLTGKIDPVPDKILVVIADPITPTTTTTTTTTDGGAETPDSTDPAVTDFDK